MNSDINFHTSDNELFTHHILLRGVLKNIYQHSHVIIKAEEGIIKQIFRYNVQRVWRLIVNILRVRRVLRNEDKLKD